MGSEAAQPPVQNRSERRDQGRAALRKQTKSAADNGVLELDAPTEFHQKDRKITELVRSTLMLCVFVYSNNY